MKVKDIKIPSGYIDHAFLKPAGDAGATRIGASAGRALLSCSKALAAVGLCVAWGVAALAAEPAGCVLSLATPQQGAYVLRDGDVFIVKEAQVASGARSCSPWYAEAFPAANGFTLALRCRATESPNAILANLGSMRGANESLVLATSGRDRLQLAVVAGERPRVARRVEIPVGDVRREHAIALRQEAGGEVTAWVDGARTDAKLKFACANTCFQLLGGYNKQKELGD